MSDGTTALDRLRRLLHILPAAAREEGASLEELASALDTTAARIVEDIEEVTNRVYYHPGGWPDNVQIEVEPDRIRVSHAGGMERPLRLTPQETLCLALALRGSPAASHEPDAHARATLIARAEAHLAQLPSDTVPDAPDLAVPDQSPDPAGVRETVLSAFRTRRPCAIVYAKAAANDLTPRVIHPYAVAYANGAWYTVGHCLVSEGMRVFRMDRITDAADADGTFDVPDTFRIEDYMEGGSVYRASHETEVRIRYSPRIARWVRERAERGQAAWTEEPDGSLIMEHRVSDPHWVVGHALQYGAEAEILEPVELRAMVVEVVSGMAG